MQRHISRPIGVLLALVFSLSIVPPAQAGQYGRGFNSRCDTSIIRILEQFAMTLGIISSVDHDTAEPAPPKP